MTADVSPAIPTYSEMFAEYLEGQTAWIGSSELPLVHHIRKLCAQLDAEGLDKAALASAYLQAIERLDKRRPRAHAPADQPAGQTTIFDFID